MTRIVVSNKSSAALAVSTLLLSMYVMPLAWAQDDSALLENVKECAQIPDPAARYACYDRSTSALRPTPAEAASRPNQPAESTQPAQSAQPARLAQPTLPVPRPTPATGPFVDLTAEPLPPADPVELIDKIAEVKEHEPGQLMVTLANGQVWYQQGNRRYPLKSGMEVRIYPGLFGASWRLSSTELKSFIQVKRLK